MTYNEVGGSPDDVDSVGVALHEVEILLQVYRVGVRRPDRGEESCYCALHTAVS